MDDPSELLSKLSDIVPLCPMENCSKLLISE